MTDDQQLIAELDQNSTARGEDYLHNGNERDLDIANLLARAATALETAAVRYRAEGWDEGANWAFEEITGDRPGQFLAPGDNPYRALLDENNETQEN